MVSLVLFHVFLVKPSLFWNGVLNHGFLILDQLFFGYPVSYFHFNLILELLEPVSDLLLLLPLNILPLLLDLLVQFKSVSLPVLHLFLLV